MILQGEVHNSEIIHDVYLSVYVCKNIYTYIYIYIHTYIYIYVCIFGYNIDTHACIYMQKKYIYIYTHTLTTQLYIQAPLSRVFTLPTKSHVTCKAIGTLRAKRT